MSEYDYVSSSLMSKILRLAVIRQMPLNLLENPGRQEDNNNWPFLAQIGNVHVGFYGFAPDDMIELYAALKSGLEAEEARNEEALAPRSGEV
jgi:hypothetical protein